MRLGTRVLDGKRRDVDADDLEAALREVDGVGAGAAADLQCPSGGDHARLDHLDQHRIGRPRVPWQRFSRSIDVVSGRMRYNGMVARKMKALVWFYLYRRSDFTQV